MRCPFLREAQVKFCCASEYKKMIVRGENDQIGERCSSADYAGCAAAKQRHEEIPNRSHCPFLQESLVQYCSAASAIKYVPYSDPNTCRCGTSSHLYCELFLMLSRPNLSDSHDVVPPPLGSDDGDESVWVVDGIQTTGWHYYSPNHLWADINQEGICHVGIDPFLASVLGEVEKLTFATTAGEHHPGVVITSHGNDFPMVFPNRINITSTNLHLRAEPSRTLSDPYTFGWLFEGTELFGNSAERIPSNSVTRSGLIHGPQARQWMESESRRLTQFIHGKLNREAPTEPALMADGGTHSSAIVRHLDKSEALLLYSEFFSPNVKMENL